jgi:hypothetical protein
VGSNPAGAGASSNIRPHSLGRRPALLFPIIAFFDYITAAKQKQPAVLGDVAP